MSGGDAVYEADLVIERIEWARLEATRPRRAGCNARLGAHGPVVRPGVARVTAGGRTGFGWSRVTQDEARRLVGAPLREAFAGGSVSVAPALRAVEFPLLDWLGQVRGRPVFAMVPQVRRFAAGDGDAGAGIAVPCYDTSLYLDDLGMSEADGVACMRRSAAEGVARGHRAFKLKVGRGAMHMPLSEGMARDVAVVRGVRDEVGPGARLMADANNGFNFNLTRQFLSDTRDAGVYWMEEPFHEDPELYRHLRQWLAGQGLTVKITDGEGDCSPHLIDWARRGLIDAVQYDIQSPGFSWWLDRAPELNQAGIGAAPHHYGALFGNFTTCHLAPALAKFELVEWDEAAAPWLDRSGYAIRDGHVEVSPRPGFGLALDDEYFRRQVRVEGWEVGAT